jgi:hypothetical protein
VLNLIMKEAQRYKVISEVGEGYLKVKEAAEVLGLSRRQVYRIRMFARPAKEPGSAYRPLAKGLSLKDIFCLKKERTVAGDNTISYQGRTFQILPNEYRISFYKTKVEVHEYLNGLVNIFYQGKKLKHKPISKERTKLFQPVMFRQAHHKIEQKEKGLITINH